MESEQLKITGEHWQLQVKLIRAESDENKTGLQKIEEEINQFCKDHDVAEVDIKVLPFGYLAVIQYWQLANQ